jgi:hypothetical protein
MDFAKPKNRYPTVLRYRMARYSTDTVTTTYVTDVIQYGTLPYGTYLPVCTSKILFFKVLLRKNVNFNEI